jgi:hypothetical protein
MSSFSTLGGFPLAMDYITLLLLCAALAFLLFMFIVAVGIPRYRMERRARSLLAQHPGAERKSVYLPLHSTFGAEKQKEVDAKIAEIKAQGWIFLQARAANPFRTIRSWGGGLNLHFIRTSGSVPI